MRWLCTICLSSLTSLLLLAACENASAPAPVPTDVRQPPIGGVEWIEQLPSDVRYHAGSFLTLSLDGDSAVIIQKHFTDMILCEITDADTLCTNPVWENRYVGSYALDDSLLTLSFAFAGTTATPSTKNWPAAAGITVSRYTWEAGDPLKLTLTGVGDGEVFPGKKTMKMAAKPKAGTE